MWHAIFEMKHFSAVDAELLRYALTGLAHQKKLLQDQIERLDSKYAQVSAMIARSITQDSIPKTKDGKPLDFIFTPRGGPAMRRRKAAQAAAKAVRSARWTPESRAKKAKEMRAWWAAKKRATKHA